MLIKIEGGPAVYDRLTQSTKLYPGDTISHDSDAPEFPIMFAGAYLPLPEPLTKVAFKISLLSDTLYSAQVIFSPNSPRCFRGLSTALEKVSPDFVRTSPHLVGYFFRKEETEPYASVTPYGDEDSGRVISIGEIGAYLRGVPSSLEDLLVDLRDLEFLINQVSNLVKPKIDSNIVSKLKDKSLILTCF